ncbi:MAG: DUF892 family protein [Solirubrobacteraceae bacterium]
MELAVDRQLDRWLIQLYAVEQQALFALRLGRRAAGHPVLAEHFGLHITETERHLAAVRRCLRARRRGPSRLAGLAATLNRLGFLDLRHGVQGHPREAAGGRTGVRVL